MECRRRRPGVVLPLPVDGRDLRVDERRGGGAPITRWAAGHEGAVPVWLRGRRRGAPWRARPRDGVHAEAVQPERAGEPRARGSGLGLMWPPPTVDIWCTLYHFWGERKGHGNGAVR